MDKQGMKAEEALATLDKQGIPYDVEAKVVLFSDRPKGLRTWKAIDCLLHWHKWYHLGEIATESFLKAKKFAEEQRKKAARAVTGNRSCL